MVLAAVYSQFVDRLASLVLQSFKVFVGHLLLVAILFAILLKQGFLKSIPIAVYPFLHRTNVIADREFTISGQAA